MAARNPALPFARELAIWNAQLDRILFRLPPPAFLPMLNYIWLTLILLSVFFGGCSGHLKEVTDGAFAGVKTAVMDISLPLVGAMALWLGVLRLAEKSGLIQIIAAALRPIMRRLFPDVPPEHPAMGAIVLNVASNMLGLGNAATPLGLRAMGYLEKLNPHPGTATNAMCTFLAINTSSVQLIPTTAIAILAAKGASNPTAIVGTALMATSCAALAGIVAVKLLEKLPVFAAPTTAAPPPSAPAAEPARAASASLSDATPVSAQTSAPPSAPTPTQTPETTPPLVPESAAPAPLSPVGWFLLTAFALGCAWMCVNVYLHPPLVSGVAVQNNGFLRLVSTVSLLAVPLVLAFFPLYAAMRGIKVYEEFVEGAKEGFGVALRIIPFLVAMLMAIGMFRGSGGMDLLTNALRPFFDAVGFPADLLPMTLMRPLSGGATTALFTDVVTHFGPDSLITRTAGTIFGSTETTFYVLAVYFGSVAVRRTRHAVAAGLIADAVGVVASVTICRLLFS